MQNARFAAIVAATLSLASAGCERRTDEQPAVPFAPRVEVLKDVPLALPARLTDTVGTSEVEKRTYLAQAPLDSVVGFYRTRLPRLGWRVVSDRIDAPVGKVDLYARKAGKTLWVHIERRGAQSTEYTLIGNAAPDTTSQRPGVRGGSSP
jgi:hypothetical protein